jgi:hypothetical protein
MPRPDPRLQVCVAEKTAANLIATAHRHPHPLLQGIKDREIGNHFFNSLLVMHWSSLLASANPLRKGRRFLRPSRKDAGRDFRGRCNGVFQIARTKPSAQFESFITETEDGHWLSAELDGCEFKSRFVGHESLAKMAGRRRAGAN